MAVVETSQAQAIRDIQSPDEVEIAHQALASLDPDDKSYFSALDTLANKLMRRFALSGDPNDLDEGISCTKQVLGLSPPGHFYHLSAVCNMGQVLTTRFKLRGDASDLSQAIAYFESAVESCTPEQPFYLAAVACLSRGLLNRFWRYGDVADLDRIVETSSTALSACPAESPHRDALFNNFASALKERFMKLGHRADLDTALKHYQSCLELRPAEHPSRCSALGNLADALFLRFEADNRMQDLESAANHYVSALQLCYPGQDCYLLYLTGLGQTYSHLYRAQGDVGQLETAISCFDAAMTHSAVHNLEHSRLLDRYAEALQLRYTLSGNVDDLDRQITYLTVSSDIQPTTYSGRHITLFSLGTAFLTRYKATGNIADLDSSIKELASTLELCQPGFHQRPFMLSVYGIALSSRFNAQGDTQDLNLATLVCKDAVAHASPTELNYPLTVANLASTLLGCFYKSGNVDESQTIIDHCDRALVSIPPTDSAFTPLKIIRADALLQKFHHGGEETDIDTAIAAFREVIPTLTEDHVEHVYYHLRFGVTLEARFGLSADPKDLNESIACYRFAKQKCKRGNLNYAPVCMQLGNALRKTFESLQGSVDTLDEAIVLLAEVEEILSLTPGNVDYKASLMNLGATLFMRFQMQRNRDDLDMAIEHVSRTLALPPSYEQFLYPVNLAILLSVRYDEDDDPEDLERCVELFGVAAGQMPPKHLCRTILCHGYAHALVKLGDRRDQLQHLDAAIALFGEALEHLSVSHSDRPLTHIHLVEALHKRAELLCDSNGLHNAIDLLRGVMQTLPEDGTTSQSVYHVAAKLFMSTHKLSGLQLPSFMEDGFRYYEKAAWYSPAHSFRSVQAALEWAEYAEQLHHSSALLAYQTALASLNQHLLTTVSVKKRHTALLERHVVQWISTLAMDAVACAIGRGELELAVELSEQGRGLLWSQMSQSRTSLDALRAASHTERALAAEFERVSAQLAQSSIAETPMTTSRLTIEESTRRYRHLSKELEDVVAHIRQQAGFESFLERPSFESLKQAALGGPVILVNISHQRCDALIVLHDAPPRLVPLSDTSLQDLTSLSTRFYRMLKTTARVGDERERERQVTVVLRSLWDSVVRPIVDALVFLPRGARIWWCPTSKLTSLPLHAAGPYRKPPALNLPSIYISSYTPTLAALIRARHRPAPSSPRLPPPSAFVAIGQAQSASAAPTLQTVDSELSLVQSLVPRSMPFSALSGKASTADAALSALGTHTWAHLACHGHPNRAQPFDSAFALGDRSATVLDIVRARTGAGDFAFLSACHTAAASAVDDRHAPDEVIHLAAAMQFAGFRSVIGTMWAVDDGMAHHMVMAFYTHLFSGGSGDGGREKWDCTQAARALNKAFKSVKDAVTIDQRIVFIHIGA